MYIQQCLKFNDLQLHPTWWVPLSLRIQATFPDTITYVLLLILSLAPKMKIKTHAWTHIKILLICWIWVYYMYILAYQIKKSSLSCHIGQSFSKLSNLIWSLNGWLFSTFFSCIQLVYILWIWRKKSGNSSSTWTIAQNSLIWEQNNDVKINVPVNWVFIFLRQKHPVSQLFL